MAAVKILADCIASFSDLAPVMTSLPVEKINAVVRGSLILITTALNLAGLYSAFLHHCAIFFKSSLQFSEQVATIFCSVGGFKLSGFCSGALINSTTDSRATVVGYDGLLI